MIKVSIITVCISPKLIDLLEIIEQLNSQTYYLLEHIIIEGTGSYDFKEIQKKYRAGIEHHHITEKDDSVYEALNKGMKKADGSLLGLLHVGDKFSDKDTLDCIVNNASGRNSFIYGNVNFLKDGVTCRKWKAEEYSANKLKYGWMPPHTSVFLGKNLYKNFEYNETYKISGDYEFLLRLLNQVKIKVEIKYIDQCIVQMSIGGLSTSGGLNFLQKIREDISVTKLYFRNPMLVVILKRATKLSQFYVSN